MTAPQLRFPRNQLGKRLHVGIFGPSLCGKTNLAKWLMLIYWQAYGVRSIVCDPNERQLWPRCALVFRDKEKFWPYVKTKRGCAVFADEGGGTVKRNNNLTEFFTRGRQDDHVLHVLGHSHANLLPEQREQLQTLFLFRQGPAGAKTWSEEWGDERLRESAGLAQYEFIWAEKFGDKATRQHAVTHGVFPEYMGA